MGVNIPGSRILCYLQVLHPKLHCQCQDNIRIPCSLGFCFACSNMLEELMDDEDEMRDMNLSSRPSREEKRRVRERDRLEREMER